MALNLAPPLASFGLTDLRGSHYTNAYAINALCNLAHANARDKGFWDDVNLTDPRHVLSLLALVTTETSEAVEAVRKEDRENFVEELADILIRVFDLAGGMDLNLGLAIHEKMHVNKSRSHKHGKTC